MSIVCLLCVYSVSIVCLFCVSEVWGASAPCATPETGKSISISLSLRSCVRASEAVRVREAEVPSYAGAKAGEKASVLGARFCNSCS